MPLHLALAVELQAIRSTEAGKRVFALNQHMCRTFRQDLLRARIEPLDVMGRKVDFHAPRKTFATRLALKGVPQRFTQELMRHSDANLTAQVYTDASLRPTFDAVASSTEVNMDCGFAILRRNDH